MRVYEGIDYHFLAMRRWWQINFIGERRVALTPAAVESLTKKGFSVSVEEGAGAGAAFNDESYQKAGAKIVDKDAAFKSDIILKVFTFLNVIFLLWTTIQWCRRLLVTNSSKELEYFCTAFILHLEQLNFFQMTG